MFMPPARSDRKFFLMFCLVLRNSLTIKFLFFWSAIFRKDMFLLGIVYLFRTWFRTWFWTWCWTLFWTWFRTWFWKWFWTWFWTWFWAWFWTWFWTSTQVVTPILFRRSSSSASVSIFPVFSRLILDFSQRSSFIRVNISNSNEISEYSSSEMESSDNAFEMKLLIRLAMKQLTSQSFHVFLFSTKAF